MGNSVVDQAKVYVALDGKDAETVMDELRAKTDKYTDALNDAYKAGDKIGMKNALADLKATEKELATVQKQTFDVTKVMKDLNGTSLNDLKKAQQSITSELSNMKRGTDEYTAKEKDYQKVTAEINKVKSGMQGVSQENITLKQRFVDLIDKIGLGNTQAGQFAKTLTSGMDSGAEKVKGFAGAFKTIKTAIAATGIGALVILITSLFAWFQKTTEGSKKLKMAMAGIGAVVDVITGLFAKVGGIIVNAFSHPVESVKALWTAIKENIVNRIEGVGAIFKSLGKIIASGFRDGYKDLGNAVIETTTGVSNGIDKLGNAIKKTKEEIQKMAEAAKIGAKIAEQEVNLAKVQRQTLIDQAKIEREIAQARYNAADKTKTDTERLKSLTAAIKGENKLQDEQNRIESINNKILHEKYDLKMKSGVKASDDEKNALAESDAQMVRIETDRLDRSRKMNAQLTALKQEMLNDELTAVETNYTKQEALAKQSLAKGEITEKQYDDKITQLTIDQLTTKNKALEDYEKKYRKLGIDMTDIDKQIAENSSEIEDAKAKKRTRDFDDLLKLNQKNGSDILNSRKILYEQDLANAGNNVAAKKDIEEKYNDDVLTLELGNLLSQEQLLKAHGQKTEDIEKQIQDKKAQIQEHNYQTQQNNQSERESALREYSLVSLATQEKDELAALKTLHDKKLLSDAEYAAASLKVKIKYDLQYFQKYTQLLSSMSSISTGLQDVEITKNTTKYQKQLEDIETAHNKGLLSDAAYNSKKTKLEDKQAQDEKKIKKKYADVTFAISVAQIMANTAVAIMKDLAELGPIAGPIAAVLTGIEGGVQIAQANAQREQVKSLGTGKYDVTGADDGQEYDNVPYIGNAGTGLYTKPTLIAERGPEIVISAPHVRNLQMNYPEVLNAIMATRVPQNYNGSYPQNNSIGSIPSKNYDQVIGSLAAVINKLNAHLDKGIKATTDFNMHQFKEVVEPQYNAMKAEITKS